MADFLDRWRMSESGKRRYRRVGAPLFGTYVAVRQRHSGAVVNISPGGVCLAIESPDGLLEGADGVFELADFGEIPARVCYVVSLGLGLDFRLDERRREALAEWLEPRVDADELDA